VYYVQYAHARCCSVLERWEGDEGELVNADCSRLVEEHELAILRKFAEFPDTIEAAASELAPHLVAFYLKELAAAFHSYYNATQILVEGDNLRLARLALCATVRQVLRNGLRLLGVSAPDKM
jgi:arginyl-tRNA synthetase